MRSVVCDGRTGMDRSLHRGLPRGFSLYGLLGARRRCHRRRQRPEQRRQFADYDVRCRFVLAVLGCGYRPWLQWSGIVPAHDGLLRHAALHHRKLTHWWLVRALRKVHALRCREWQRSF